MPKEVDHVARRRELADAACTVIARNGLAGTTLAHVADESGWSIGSIRHYFPTKDEPLAARLAHLIQAGDLPARLDAEHEAARLRVLLDGLRLQLITTPRQTTVKWALTVLEDHLAALADG